MSDDTQTISPDATQTPAPQPEPLPDYDTWVSQPSEVNKPESQGPPQAEGPIDTSGITPINQFKVDALDIVQRAPDYQTGANQLIDYYKNNKFDDPEASNVLSDYGNDLRYKFNESIDPATTVAIAPIKMSQIEGADPIERINEWEKQNQEFLEQTTDPDYLTTKKQLKSSIDFIASEGRRDALDGGDGLAAWGKDKFFRFAQGAAGSFSKLVGGTDAESYLHERTSRSRDEGIAGKVAETLGFLGPAALAGALTEGAAVGPMLAAQSTGEIRGAYDASIEATGDPDKATRSAVLTGAAQAVQFAPLGRAVSGLTKTIGGKAVEGAVEQSLAKPLADAAVDRSLKTVGANVLGAATGGAAGQVIGNLASNIGLNQDGDITHGTLDAFLVGGITAGVVHGAEILAGKAVEKQLGEKIDETKASLKGQIPPEKPVPGEVSPDKIQADTSSPNYMLNEEGNIIEGPPKPRTVAQRKADKAFYDKAVDDYIYEEPTEEHSISDEAGDNRPPAYADDEMVKDIPPDTVITSYGQEEGAQNVQKDIASEGFGGNKFGASASNAVKWFAGKFLGANFELRKNISNGAFGAFAVGQEQIRILRSLGANPEKLKETMAHEIGHFIDKILNSAFTSKGLKSVSEKLAGLKNISDLAAADKYLRKAAKTISMRWRPGWDGKPGDAKSADPAERFRAYRNEPVEIYADVFSAIVNDPISVRAKFPELMKAFEQGLVRNPEINAFWTQMRKFEADPKELSRFNMQIRGESRSQSGQIVAAERLNKIKNNSVGAKLQRALSQSFEYVFNKATVLPRIANKLVGDAREAAYEHILAFKRKDMWRNWFDREIDGPLQKLDLERKEAGIDSNTWAHYEWQNHVQNDETPTMARVRENFGIYKKAAEDLKTILYQLPGVKGQMVEKAFSPKAFESPENLNDAFAQIGLIGDAAEALKLTDFVNRFSPDDPQRAAKAMTAYKRAVANLNRRRESIPIEVLRKVIQKMPKGEIKTALEDITKDGAFNARRYLVNTDGATVYDAALDLATIQHDLGPEKFAKLQSISKRFHETFGKMHDTIVKSNMLGPEVEGRIAQNKANYVTTQVLKYFEGEDSIDASIKKSIGSLSETGDELSATYNKQKAVFVRATYQIAKNSAVHIAELGGQIVEKIKPKYGESIFDKQKLLSASDKEHSYIISYPEKGQPVLNKIETKSYENMFKDVRTFPVAEVFLQLADNFNKAFLTRQLKTYLNPGFILGQKMYDRKLEAVFANSLYPTFFTKHIDPKLRGFDKLTISEIKHAQKTGELTGELKKVIDLNAATLDLHVDAAEHTPTGMTFADVQYENFGTKLPNEKNIFERIGNFTEQTLEKIGGKKLKEYTDADELRAKVNGFRIAKEILGMGDAEAAVFTQEKFGIPDPFSGGVAAPLINRMFLFGRAHFNGLRALGSLVKDMKGTAATQVALRVVFPKLLVTGLAVEAVRMAFGDEDAEKYQTVLNMIPKYDKIATNVVPLGFQDGQGKFHNFLDVEAKDIQSDWKAWYTREPQARELTSIAKIAWPFIEGLTAGKPATAVGGAATGAQSELTGSVQPALQYMYNILEMVKGNNPTDFYRMKGILDKDTAAGGTLLDKGVGYSQYVLAQQYPSFVPYNPFATQDPHGLAETAIRKYPFVGPMIRRMVGVSNYGLVEQSKDAQLAHEALTAEIALSTGDKTKSLLSDFRYANGKISSLGKGWQTVVGPDVAQQLRTVTSWHSKVWVPYMNELRAAREAGDDERYKYLVDSLEEASGPIKEQLQNLKAEK